jgi:type II secretory pathway pseudopilin PulG
MRRIIKQSDKKTAFTIIELLTVMSIIVILIGLLVPAMSMAKQYAKKLKQMAMFHSIDAAMELFNNEFDGYPPSGALDPPPTELSYCGAMKLFEAMMGQDMLGFHSN